MIMKENVFVIHAKVMKCHDICNLFSKGFTEVGVGRRRERHTWKEVREDSTWQMFIGESR